MSSKKMHPADAADRAAIANAVSFNVHLRKSPTSKINEPAATLVEAVKIADKIKTENKGRNVLIYGIDANGTSTPVPQDMQTAARAPDFVDAPADAVEIPAFLLKGSVLNQVAEVAPEPPAAPSKPQRAAKTTTATPKSDAPAGGKRGAALEAAQRGEVPAAPDFSAETHKRFRNKLAEVVKFVEAGDVAALRAFSINPVSSSPKAIIKYRDLAVVALEARAATKDAA